MMDAVVRMLDHFIQMVCVGHDRQDQGEFGTQDFQLPIRQFDFHDIL